MSDLTCIWVAKLSSVAWSHDNLQTYMYNFIFLSCLWRILPIVYGSKSITEIVRDGPTCPEEALHHSKQCYQQARLTLRPCQRDFSSDSRPVFVQRLRKIRCFWWKGKKKNGAFWVEWEAEKKQQHEERFPLSFCSIEIWPAVMETDRNNFGKSSWVIRSSPSASTSRSCSNACVPRKTITTPGRRWPWIARIKEIHTGSEPRLIVKLLW